MVRLELTISRKCHDYNTYDPASKKPSSYALHQCTQENTRLK